MAINNTKITIANNRLVTTRQPYWAASIGALLLVGISWPHVAAWQALSAAAILIAANHQMQFIACRFRSDPAGDARADYWEKWLVRGNLIAGVAWGLSLALFYIKAPPDVAPMLGLFAGLLIGGCCLVLVPAVKCIFAFALPATAPTLLAVLARGSLQDCLIGVAILLFVYAVINHTRVVAGAYRASVDLASGLETQMQTATQGKEAVQQNYARLRDLLDRVPGPIFVTRLADGVVLYMNRATLDIAGIKHMADVAGAPAIDFLVDPGEWDKMIAKVTGEASGGSLEFQVKRSDGYLFWVLCAVSNMTYEDQPAIIGTLTDITQRREAEEAQRQSEEKLRQSAEQHSSQLQALLEAVPAPIILARKKDGQILYINQLAYAMSGIKCLTDNPKASSLDLFADPADRGKLLQSLKNTNGEHSLELQLKRGDGSLFWSLLTVNEIMHEGEASIISTFIDITKRHEAENALRQSEEKFRMLADHAHDLISIFSLDSVCLYVSPSIERLLGYRQEEFVGQKLGKFVHPDDISAIMSSNAKSTDRDGRPPVYMFRIRHKNGGWEWVEGSSSVQRDPDTGKFSHVSSVSRLVTERVRYEQELKDARERAETADRAKSEFLAHMSHEIRTPLNAVIGFSEVMRDELFGPLGSPRYLEYMNDIHNSGTHLLALINDILDISKVEAGKFELQEDRVPLRTFIESAMRFMHERAAAKHIKLELHLGVEPDLWCDRRVLTQVMLNLIGNAIKFTNELGRIVIDSSLDGSGNLILTLMDNGIGIAAEDLETVMQPFGQARTGSSIATKNAGTGLGLPLSRALVEKHGGTLTIASEAGIGTRVTIMLPAVRVIPCETDAKRAVNAG